MLQNRHAMTKIQKNSYIFTFAMVCCSISACRIPAK